VCYPTLGGSGIMATELAVGLVRRGHRVHVIASAPPSRPLPECSRLFFHEVSVPNYPLFDQAPYMLALASAIANVTSERGIDLVHVHYAVPHAASAYLARQVLGARAPALVTTLHGTDVTRIGADPSYQEITRFCVESSDAITVPSLYLKEQAQRLLGIAPERAIELIPNFVDTDRFAPPPARDNARFDDLFEVAATRSVTAGPVLFHASNFRSVKRVTDLLEVLARVRRTVPARLLLVGDGPDRAAAEQRARSLGIQRSVCFLGKRPDFVEYLRHADAFLLTSETESFGLAALESLSCGVPVLGYRVGGVPAVVSEDVGRLVEPFDLDALAAAVVSVLSSTSLRQTLGAAARERVLASFRAEPALDRYESLFHQVLATRRERSA
jgi:N-acetyl-alpha-D-glucosaminyl L-malate synthase BshA